MILTAAISVISLEAPQFKMYHMTMIHDGAHQNLNG